MSFLIGKTCRNDHWSCKLIAYVVALLGIPVVLVFLAFPRLSLAQDSYCAEVKIQIQQELTLERQAFEAHMRINNGLDTIAIEDVEISVAFTDEDGAPVLATSDPNNTDAAFFIRVESMNGIDNVTGTGRVAPGTSADINWLIIPAAGTGGVVPSGQLYYVGATLSYTLGGNQEVVEVSPDFILVKPMPALTLDYFLPHEVYADDAFTPQIEPAVPFALGVRVINAGSGAAGNLKIDTAQPRIVENEQGLLIDFRILGSSVNDQSADADLLLDFGDLAPTSAKVGRWLMTTTLSGEFTQFSANFSHADELGGELTSLLDAVNTHLLVHDVLVGLPGRDAVRDFLARDGDALRLYESSGLDSDVSDHSLVAQFVSSGQIGEQTSYSLNVPATAGFFYAKLPDPHAGSKAITAVVRADGKTLSPHNTWRSRTRASGAQWDYFINFFDANTSGQYNVTMRTDIAAPQAPALQFIPDRQVAEGRNLAFIIEASDPNGTVPTITAGSLPTGASLGDETVTNIAVYGFDWTPARGQAQILADGSYAPYQLTFTASDGVLESSQVVEVLVCPEWDTDCDRMADAWELQRFGTLVRDGAGDYDGDGVSDLDEYLNATEVLISLKPGLNVFSYPYAVPIEHDTCRELLGALSTGGEIDSLSRFDTDTQQYESCTATGGVDFPIVTGEGYFAQVEGAQDLLLEDDAVCSAPDLLAGLNLRGHTRPHGEVTCFAWLRAIGVDAISSIRRFDTDSGRFETCAFNGSDANAAPVGMDFPILPGEGYLLYAPQAGAATLPGCGN